MTSLSVSQFVELVGVKEIVMSPDAAMVKVISVEFTSVEAMLPADAVTLATSSRLAPVIRKICVFRVPLGG